MMEMEGEGVPRIERGHVMLRERGRRCEICTEKGLQKGKKKKKKKRT